MLIHIINMIKAILALAIMLVVAGIVIECWRTLKRSKKEY